METLEAEKRTQFRVALVHDWLIHMRGGEKVLESFAEMYPEATIYTLFYDRKKLSPSLQRMSIKASFLQRIPGIRLIYRWLLPILPWAISTLRIDSAAMVISSSHCVAKAISIPRGAVHICYCHTPMRYLWGFEEDYFGNFPALIRPIISRFLKILSRFDLKSNDNVKKFIANSEYVKNRIRKYYGRDAEVVYPPVDLSQFSPSPSVSKREYYLVVSAFVPYKRVDVVIEAFNGLDRTLFVVGSGPMAKAYEKLRKNPKISFLGAVPGDQLKKLFSEAKALIFPTEEDFGIVPLEAQACGTPVIALGRGGALESVKSGIFFKDQTPEAIRRAVLDFESQTFNRSDIPQKVQGFGKDRFKSEMQSIVDSYRKKLHVAR